MAKKLLILLFVFFLSYLPVIGEGSAIYNNGSATGRTFINTSKAARLDTIFRVYVKPGEKVLLGSSSFMKSIDISVTLPDGTQQTYDITAEGYTVNTSNNCRYDPGGYPVVFTKSPTSRSKGFILNHAEEQAGPKPFNASGFDPIKIEIDQEGYLDVHFYASNSSAMGSYTRYDSAFQHNPVVDGAYICGSSFIDAVGAWDITVVGVNGLKQDGRVFTDHLVFRHNANHNSIFVGYVLTDDGYIYKVDTGKINGIDWYFFANNRGIVHTASDKNFYGSLYGCLLNSNNGGVQDSSGYNRGCGFQTYFPTNLNFVKNSNGDVAYRIFLNYPDADLLSYINLSAPAPEIPEISNLAFTKSQSDGSGTFSFSTSEEGNIYTLEVELLSQNSTVGTVYFSGHTESENTISWDGKNSEGDTVPYDHLKATLRVKRGEMHILFDDIEYIYDGIKSICMNCSTGNPSMVRYNNSNVTFEGVNNRMNMYIQGVPKNMVVYNGNLVDADDTSKIYFYGDLNKSTGVDSYSVPILRSDYRYSDLVSLNMWSEGAANEIERLYDFSTTSIVVKKVWQDDSNRDSFRPDSIQFNLICGTAECGDNPYTITEDNGWTVTVPDVPIYDSSGQEYTYSVVELGVGE